MNQEKSTTSVYASLDRETLAKSMQASCGKIAPLWPLENFVAVNPYLGLTNLSFDAAAERLMQVGGIESTAQPSFYQRAVESGMVADQDLREALSRKQPGQKTDVESFLKSVEFTKDGSSREASAEGFADVADKVCSKNWSGFMTDRITSWAASYFDKGQAQWKAACAAEGIYSAWRFEAENDRTPDIMGLKGFREAISSLPKDPVAAVATVLDALGVHEGASDHYFHRLLVRHGGWAAYIAHLDWTARLYEREADGLSEFLSVLVSWEYGMYMALNSSELATAWTEAREAMEHPALTADTHRDLQNRLVMQEAYDLASQRELIQKFESHTAAKTSTNDMPAVQAVFCIDVRSELFRRNLESVSPEIETLGFAGFFGFPIKYRPLGHAEAQDHCPVLLPAAHQVSETVADGKRDKETLEKRKSNRLVSHALKTFRTGAVSGFGFVSPLGLSYLPKLFTDSFGLTRPVPNPDTTGFSEGDYQKRKMSSEPGTGDNLTCGIPKDTKIQMAKGALTAMSLTEGFARLVLVAGHGARTVNNPHASGLDCGACAGRSGEANARVAADVLNDPEVRLSLRESGIEIPDSTWFIAGLHDTTTDEVTLYQTENVPPSHHSDVSRLEVTLAKAGVGARAERALRMHISGKGDTDLAVIGRSRDWSQVRPEWGLAGCSAFVAAPRNMTKSINLEGRSFLHSYEWKKDRDFKVLEGIMTAPVIVASWISLQYYGSTVDNEHYGSGNKTLHNVTAGIGVLEGYAGDLRTGLPVQSVHDGTDFQHRPLRLSVVVNAPKEALSEILEKHASVKALCDNGWIFLMVLDDAGKVRYRYRHNLEWEAVGGSSAARTESKEGVDDVLMQSAR